MPDNLPGFNLKILIVEDNLSLALDLEMVVKDLGYHVIGNVDNSGDAFDLIYSNHPDLILMDIDIKGKLSGIDIAEKIKPLDIPVLFITSFAQESYYDKATLTNLIGYMVKPIDKFSLRSAIEMAFRRLSNKKDAPKDAVLPFKDALFFKKGGILHKVRFEQILFVKADGDYIEIFCSNKLTFISSLSISQMLNILHPEIFKKTHRSYIANLENVDAIDLKTNDLIISEYRIPVSRSQKPIILGHINSIKS